MIKIYHTPGCLSNIITITYDVYIIGIFPIIWNIPDDNYILSSEFYNRIYIIGLVVVDCLAVLEIVELAFARPHRPGLKESLIPLVCRQAFP